MRSRILLGAVALGILGASPAEANVKKNKELCKKFYEQVVNQGKMEMFDELIAEDFIEHEEMPGLASGREGVRQFFTMLRGAFPDIKMDIKFMVAEGDLVSIYLEMSGTHKGEFMGMPASGNTFTTGVVDIVRIKRGKAVEHWGVTDVMRMMHQLQGGAHEGHEGHDHHH